MRARELRGGAAALALLAAGLTVGSRAAPEGRPAERAGGGPATSGTAAGLLGTDSCSGRACHGGIEPLTDHTRIQGNELTVWVTRDKHADAYRVLFQPRAKAIAEKLYGPERPAHQEQRCLACHTVPQAAAASAPAALLRAGVECQACHGPAEKWLGSHTTVAWADLKGEKREAKQKELGMTPTGSSRVLAQVCAGCHVGAPPDEPHGIPLRNVNHDLIAAGHPRLDFELGAFLVNMPHHWRESKNQELNDAPLVWAVGQVTSARAALKLLEYRARDPVSPWPEFAESSCFACHHDLREPSWRQKERRYRGKPGTLPWNDWYFFMPHVLAARPRRRTRRSFPPSSGCGRKWRSRSPIATRLLLGRRKSQSCWQPGRRSWVSRTVPCFGMRSAHSPGTRSNWSC